MKSTSLQHYLRGIRIQLNVAPNTSPTAVHFKDKIWLFFNGQGGNGTFGYTFDGKEWDQGRPLKEIIKAEQNFLPDTSPSAAVFKDNLYLFWNQNGVIFMTSTSNGQNWTPPASLYDLTKQTVRISNPTSPAAVVAGNNLYVLYNGIGDDGPWYTFLQPHQIKTNDWTQASAFRFQINQPCEFLHNTSPSGIALGDGDYPRMLFMWTGSGGGTWFFVESRNGRKPDEVALRTMIGPQDIGATNTCGICFKDTVYIWWRNNSDGALFMTEAPLSTLTA
ncbi:hypothetical protein CPB86DRAFT_814455 [Serendipita vermifera]|nr:hypothetical protein CPB86DRAFT_814455 [Serendipita vermifera]